MDFWLIIGDLCFTHGYKKKGETNLFVSPLLLNRCNSAKSANFWLNTPPRQRSFLPFLLPDRQPYITNYPAGAVLGQFLEYWAVTKHIFNYSKSAKIPA